MTDSRPYKPVALMLKAGIGFILMLMLFSCSPTRQLAENEFLLRKNKIVVKGEKFSKEQLTPLIRQKPNKKVLFIFRFHLGAYTLGNKLKKDSRFKRLLLNTIGEPPVLLDTVLTLRSASQMEMYLNSKGHFYSEVSSQTSGNKKKVVTYTVNVTQPYTLQNLAFQIEDPRLRLIVEANRESGLIKPESNYDEDVFSDERDRITTLMRSKGYYYFSRDHIRFVVDTNQQHLRFNLTISIPNRSHRDPALPDTLVKRNYTRYYVGKVHFMPDKPKTTDFCTDSLPSPEMPGYYYLFTYEKEFEYKSPSIERSIFIKPGSLYDVRDVSQTIRALSRLNNFKYTNIVFTPSDTSAADEGSGTGFLDCYIYYTRANKRSVSAEAELRNTSGSLGLAGNIGLTNRNIFKGAENFRLTASGAMEVQQTPGIETDPSGFLPFNTFEAGLNASLEVPRFLMPIPQSRFPRYFKPKSTILLGFNYQQRTDYIRYISNISFGYDWQETQQKRHIILPYEINLVKVLPTDAFLERIKNLDPVIRNAYSDHFITASKYTFLFTNQALNRPRNFSYLRYNLELAGTSVFLASKWTKGAVDPNEGYRIFSIRFAQYVRTDADYRYYHYFDPNNILAFRAAVGYGRPFGNSQILPFEKSYFVGGSNGIRAWNIRSLGPGGFNETGAPQIDRFGNIALESSVEYRFPVYKFLKSALFVDAGNVWLEKANTSLPDGEFAINRFYREIAVGAGFGFRLDFSFFVLRTDFAVPIHNPGLPVGNRWIERFRPSDLKFNLGIGYPF